MIVTDVLTREDYDVPAGANVMTCGICGRSWDDARVTSVTPVPGGRCPFEYEHEALPARVIDNLTAAVTETLASIAEADAIIRETVASTQASMPGACEAERADAAGRRIAIVIGERLSQRFDGAVRHDGLHDCLWMTFMSQVAWDDVARYWLDLPPAGEPMH